MLWLLRVAWATLPATAGAALADALDAWSPSPRVVAAVLLWVVWSIGLLGVFVPRPVSVTAVRVIAPIGVALAVVATRSTSTANGVLAATCALLASVLVALPWLAEAGLNALAYGDERRFPLKVPPALFLGPLPLSVALLGAALSTGPLLLADRRVGWGLVALAVGLPLALVLWRAFLGLSRRMVVLVPAGIVIVDPTNLGDPYLFPHERIARLRPLEPRERPDPTALDTRGGAFVGALALELNTPADVLRVRPGRRGGAMAAVSQVWFAPARPRAFRAVAVARRPRRIA